MILTQNGRSGQRPNQEFPRPSAYHRWDSLGATIPGLRWLETNIRRYRVPRSYTAFWKFWDPVDKRIAGLMRGRDRNAWLAVRGHLMRVAIDHQADMEGRRYV